MKFEELSDKAKFRVFLDYLRGMDNDENRDDTLSFHEFKKEAPWDYDGERFDKKGRRIP